MLDQVHQADEAFVTGTFGGITPVRSLDNVTLGDRMPGEVTERVLALYESLKDAQASG